MQLFCELPVGRPDFVLRRVTFHGKNGIGILAQLALRRFNALPAQPILVRNARRPGKSSAAPGETLRRLHGSDELRHSSRRGIHKRIAAMRVGVPKELKDSEYRV